MKNYLLSLLAMTALSAASLGATTINVALASPNQSGVPGATLLYFGTITNTGGSTIYLNSDDLNITASPGAFFINDLFAANVPLYLDPGASTGSIELFDVTIANPFTDPLYIASPGNYTLQGGIDGNAGDILSSTDFSVTVTPEPASLALAFGGLAAVGLVRRRQTRR